jgi:hypothetical protein
LPADTDRFITIVSGLPRCGTAMMMRMLEAGGMPVVVDNIRAADEDNPAGYYEFEPVKQTSKDGSWLPAAVGNAVKMVYRLLYDLPPGYRYRVLFMQRKLEEVLASQQKMLARGGRAESSAASDEQMSRLFRAELQKFAAWISTRPEMRMLEVSYNDLLAAPRPIAQKINDFLGGELDTQAMVRVVDPTLYRNRL